MNRHFYIDNFKSLVDFALPTDMGQFTCIVGLNGSSNQMNDRSPELVDDDILVAQFIVALVCLRRASGFV